MVLYYSPELLYFCSYSLDIAHHTFACFLSSHINGSWEFGFLSTSSSICANLTSSSFF